jgi:UDP-N-acetyl-D-galactosamine dehydrogenase
VQDPQPGQYDAMILAVGHRDFIELGVERIRALGKTDGSILFDVKYALPKNAVDARL